MLIDGLLDQGRGLADAHTIGVVHRDLKPSNILVQPNGVLKLVDFDVCFVSAIAESPITISAPLATPRRKS